MYCFIVLLLYCFIVVLFYCFIALLLYCFIRFGEPMIVDAERHRPTPWTLVAWAKTIQCEMLVETELAALAPKNNLNASQSTSLQKWLNILIANQWKTRLRLDAFGGGTCVLKGSPHLSAAKTIKTIKQ